MTNLKDKRERLRLILSQAHRQKQAVAPRPDRAWRNNLMNSLPGIRRETERAEQWAFLEKLVWRMVPAAGAVALGLALLVGHASYDPAGDLQRIMSADSMSSGLYTFYQSESSHE